MSNAEGPELSTFADRVIWAWNSLPRKKGRPPAWKLLEREHGVPLATFSKLFSGERSTVTLATLPRLAEALQVKEEWLTRREGPDPVPTGTIIGRGEDRYGDIDPSAWVRKYSAIGAIPPGGPNPFQVAALYLGSDVDADIIEELAAEARGREDTRTAQGWGAELKRRQDARKAAQAAEKEAKKRPAKKAHPERKRRAG